MQTNEIMLKVENVSKVYRLGEIGGTTLRDELQRLSAKIRRKDDPTKKVGTKNYHKGERFMALDSVSFEVKKGERIGIIGHNGAGKSTLLKLISRVTGPSAGKIFLNGRVASMLEVGTGFHPELTGRENIYMNGAILGMTKKEIDNKMENIIDFSEVRQFIDTPVKRYSSGMYVKLAFSVAAHLDSEIMIMDEVLAVGDMAFQQKCIKKMKDVSTNDNRTVLYVSHNMNTIMQLCDRVIVLEKGKIVFDGPTEEGIGNYFKNKIDYTKSVVDVKDFQRPQSAKLNAKIDVFAIDSDEKLIFERGKTIPIRLLWHSNADVEELMFRITIKNQSDIAIATSISNSFCNAKKNKCYNTVFELGTSLLSESYYCISVALFEKNREQYVVQDHLTRVCSFKIEENNHANDFISEWSEQYWGLIHYPKPHLISHEEVRNDEDN